jgi:hypothetical protein
MIVIFSYRESYTQTDRCGYVTNTSQSDFRMHACETEEDAAEWIADRIKEDPRADYNHIIVDDWKTLEHMAQHGYMNSPSSKENSITLPWTHEDKYGDDYEAYQQQEQRNGELHARVTELVKEKLVPPKWC